MFGVEKAEKRGSLYVARLDRYGSLLKSARRRYVSIYSRSHTVAYYAVRNDMNEERLMVVSEVD